MSRLCQFCPNKQRSSEPFMCLNVEYNQTGQICSCRHAVGYITVYTGSPSVIVQELCENRGGRPGLSVLTSHLVSVDVKNY